MKIPKPDFPDIVHGILQHNIFYWVKKSMDSDCIAAKENLDSIEGNAEKNITSAYNTLTAILKHFSNENLDKLLARNPKRIFLLTHLKKEPIFTYIYHKSTWMPMLLSLH